MLKREIKAIDAPSHPIIYRSKQFLEISFALSFAVFLLRQSLERQQQ